MCLIMKHIEEFRYLMQLRPRPFHGEAERIVSKIALHRLQLPSSQENPVIVATLEEEAVPLK